MAEGPDSVKDTDEEEEPLDGTFIADYPNHMTLTTSTAVLDLPQIYQRPSANVLLSTLADLSVLPPSWNAPASPSPVNRASKRKIKNQGIPAYLTKIISSPLAWIEDDGIKEHIWEIAALRLSERSGRTGMGGFSRVFEIPLSPAPFSTGDDNERSSSVREAIREGDREVLRVSLHEPALSEDNLGLKTWAASYLLAQRLPLLKSSLFPGLESDIPILELGSGTGLVGLAAAAIFGCAVLLTDLPAIVPNLERNARANTDVIAANDGNVRVAILDWTRPQDIIYTDVEKPDPVPACSPHRHHAFSFILAADPIYSSSHPELIVNAIAYHLSRDPNARVVIELPLREAFGRERTDLKERLQKMRLTLIEQGEDLGYDDWTETTDNGEERRVEVRCWWGIWGWSE